MFGRLAEKLADTGWCNCIPLIPATKRALVPWRVHRVFCVTDEQRTEWAERFPNAGVGYVVEPTVVAVEADILDPSTAERLGVLAELHLGVTPLIRIGRARAPPRVAPEGQVGLCTCAVLRRRVARPAAGREKR